MPRSVGLRTPKSSVKVFISVMAPMLQHDPRRQRRRVAGRRAAKAHEPVSNLRGQAGQQ